MYTFPMSGPVDVNAEVLSNTRLSPDYNVLALAAPEVASATLPGQFVMVRKDGGSDPLLRRPFSVFEILRDQHGRVRGLSLLVKRVGVSTERLYQASPGDRINCLGPLGKPFSPVAPPAEAWMVAGGVGLAPFATLTEALQRSGTPTTLFYGGRAADDLFYQEWFVRAGVRLVVATEDGSLGIHGRVTVPLEQALREHEAAPDIRIYACGPEPMLKEVGRLSTTWRRTSELSMERIMGCGMGGCYSCVVRVRDAAGRPHYARSCSAGPVFSGDDIVWD
jgi:dihydroorotate dehydrogenase electron transfer subunit